MMNFYVLVRNKQALAVNWAGHGKRGVYVDFDPEKADQIILVKGRSKKDSRIGEYYQFKDGEVGSMTTPRKRIQIHGQVHGVRERVSFDMTRKDAKQLYMWLSSVFEESPRTGTLGEKE